jgi:hypothetical protein
MLLIILQFVPSYASKEYDLSEAGLVIGEILSHSLVYDYPSVYPIFKIVPILLLACIIFLQNRVTHLFSLYVGVTYVLFAFLQSIAFTEKYGLGIITANLVMFNLVAAFWFWEAFARKNDFTPTRQPTWKYWVVPFAFLAFWYPLNPVTMMPDFNPAYLLLNVAGLTFCMMTPVYLSILTIYHPKVNITTLRVTSLVGIIIGFYNMLVNFVFSPSLLWWNGVLHIPLIVISVYALILSLRNVHLQKES